jgi:cyclic-di-AMP phosphodiesterase PgpH
MPSENSRTGLRSGPVTRGGRVKRASDAGEHWWRRLSDDAFGPKVGAGVLISAAFAFFACLLVLWTRDQPLVAVGRVMDETRIVRAALSIEDPALTQDKRDAARQSTPRVYAVVQPQFEPIRASLENLPKAIAGVESLDAVDPGIREQFALTPDLLAALKSEVVDGGPSSAWLTNVANLHVRLKRRPIVDGQTFQRSVQEGPHIIRLMFEGDGVLEVMSGEIVSADDRERLVEAMTAVARDAGFMDPLRELVVNRLTIGAKPTFRFDTDATKLAQNQAADAVKPVQRTSPVGQVIFQRGEELQEDKATLYRAEIKQFQHEAPLWRDLLRKGAIVAAVAAITLTLAAYTVLFCPRVRRNSSRMAGVAGILLGATAIACLGTASRPDFWSITALTPTVFVALLISIGYDRRAALAYAILQGLLVCIATRASIGTLATMIGGIACVVIMAREIRHRNALFRLSVVTAGVTALTWIGFGIIERPVLNAQLPGSKTDIGLAVLLEIIQDAGLAAAGVLVVGSSTLFLLPWIERIFDVATGMTLMELRDPRQPLLRELQMRAPGTYNHSLNVAAIAESAAEAIQGDALLTYVGALYHDVGKMSKPEYFVENQLGGPSKHDKLSPAMSLLVVVGHVKDGVELAREYRLPRNVQHFVESHHGTTLVEYFYHRAKQQAEARREDDDIDEASLPDEIEYRYPGPKPQTKEAAVLMICDAVESATRAMSEPTPARIENLVRTIANKRLLDGQFDDCELTLKELTAIVESVSRTLASMYHGRIAYPAAQVPKTSAGIIDAAGATRRA